MSKPRFTVGSVSGYGGGGGPGSYWGTTWYVYDRAHAHAIVRTFSAGGTGARDPEVNARSLAAFLNDGPEPIRACLHCETPMAAGLVMDKRAWRWREYCSRDCAQFKTRPVKAALLGAETRTLSATPGFWAPVAARRAAGENAEPTSSPKQLPLWEWDGELPVPYGVVPY